MRFARSSRSSRSRRSNRLELPPTRRARRGFRRAGAVRDAADRSARGLLEGPRVQAAFVNAASSAQRQFVAVLDGDNAILQTSGGKVVLDVRPLVLELGGRFGLTDLESRIPAGAGRITILESNQLKTAQDLTKLLRFVADWIWVLALAAAASAVWLARGRRRLEIRANAIGLLIAGVLILIVQTLIGRYLVGHLATTESVRPAVATVYSIVTELLRGAGWTGIIVALVALVGIWLSGSKPRAVATRRWLSPYLRRAEVAYGAVVVGYLLLLWWRPTPQLGFPITVALLLVLALFGLEVLRRQTAREFPDAEPQDLLAAMRARTARGRAAAGRDSAADELERLAQLHAQGTLDDAEFAAAKAQLLGIRPLAGVP